MAAVWVVLALVPWIVIGAVGVPLAATGRLIPPGLPIGYREGWRLRVTGLVFVAIALYMTFQTVENGARYWDSVVFTYAGLAYAIGLTIYKSRNQGKGAARMPRPGSST